MWQRRHDQAGLREEAQPMRAASRAMGKAAYGALWCFVLVLPWDVFVNLPVVGSIPRIVGLVASAGGVLYVLARRSLTPVSWFHRFAALCVLWAGVSSFWSIDPEATRTRVITYLQLVVLVWLIWEIAWSSARQRALFQAYVVGASVAALVTIHNFLSGPLGAESGIARFTALNQDANELGAQGAGEKVVDRDRKSTRLNSSHVEISYAVFCLKKKKRNIRHRQ